MFLPTKAHDREIVSGQYKIRLGNRVPMDAVNLAYTHIPPVNPDENIQVTDLSDTILENHRSAKQSEIRMYPDLSLLLHDDNGESEIPTEDVLITNIFKEDVPLYYCYQLTYRHYDKKGPDMYGIYNRDGITLIDKHGRPVHRPYQIQLIPDTDQIDLYYVTVYTSFKDKESDDYEVLYNAVNVKEDGTVETYSGYREPITLQRAFNKTEDSAKIIDLIQKREIFPLYYQANGSRSGSSKLYVPTPRIKDHRRSEAFRFQVGMEIETESERAIYTTPWYSEDVMNVRDLTAEEEKEYINGFKQITEKTTERIMQDFVPDVYFGEDKKTLRRYFVNIDNPRVKESMRIDGSSPVYVSTVTEFDNNTIFVPKNARITKAPVQRTANIHYKLRPLYAGSNEIAFVSFVIDNSESMGVNDPEKVLRFKMMESLLYSARQFYSQNMMNAYYFNFKTFIVRKEFAVGDIDLINQYEEVATIDSDITNPIPAIDQAIAQLNTVSNTYTSGTGVNSIVKTNKKYMILVTDGQMGDLSLLREKVKEAKDHQITLCFITFSQFKELNAITKEFDSLCIDATSPRLAMELKYFFFKMAGINESIEIERYQPFSMSPTDNDLTLRYIDDSTFALPSNVLKEKERFAIEIELSPTPYMPEISLYLKDTGTKEVMPTTNSAYIIPLELLEKERSFELLAHSEAWDYYFSHTYAVRFNDRRKVQLLPPREKSSLLNWYPRIRNGRFDRMLLDREEQPVYHYSIPEYYRQEFLSHKGHPYKAINKERPEVITNTQIRVRHTPLYINFNGEEATNIKVWVNYRPIRVKRWNSFDGLLELDGIITDNDDIFVDYEYEEDSYVYRGYYNESDQRFWHLDLNPTKGHYVTVRDKVDGKVKDVPSFTLINKTVYFYIKPSSRIKRNADGTYRPASDVESYTLFHSFEKVIDRQALLIGEIRVRPNSNMENLSLTDTRVRGGGLKESITPEIMREFEEESFYYWDIGHWDGLPYPENAVTVIRLSKRVLKEHGGLFTKAEVEDKLNKYLGYGVLALIEYIEDADNLLQVPEDLVIEVIDVEDLGELTIMKPTFETSLEDK